MIKSEKRLIIIELILIIVFLSNIFVRNIFNEYSLFIILTIVNVLIYFLMGYEKDKNIYKKNLIFFITFYLIAFITMMYGIGLVLGYTKSPFKTDIISIIKNIFPIILVICSSEMLRYQISKKGEKNNFIFVLTIMLFIIIDIVLNVKFYNLTKLENILKFSTIIILPSIFKNWMLTAFTYKYGLAQNIIYRLILELYPYILPITPDLGIYLESVLLMVFPVLLKRNISFRFDKDKKIDLKYKNYKKRIITFTTIVFISLIIALNSNLFRYWMAIIGSGSMEPTINIGDAVIVDKRYQKHLDKLKIGDILVFKNGQKIYVHRIVNIDHREKNYYINTKGDRKEQIEDSWIVTNKDIIGVVKFKIKYIGYPTVWLSRILEEK